MKKEVRQYLHQVKKNLCCPSSLGRTFLRQLEDDISLFCEGLESVTLAQISEEFGDPKDVAADFFASLDAKTVSRYSYTRLKVTYGILAVVLVAALIGVGIKLYDYLQARILLEQSVTGEDCGDWHPCYNIHVHDKYVCAPEDAANCTVLRLRTQRKGRDYYWEYHSCTNRFYHVLPMEDSDGTLPYASDLYVTNKGIVTHWHFDDKHTGWYKIYDEE